jgi:hypothetical protein
MLFSSAKIRPDENREKFTYATNKGLHIFTYQIEDIGPARSPCTARGVYPATLGAPRSSAAIPEISAAFASFAPPFAFEQILRASISHRMVVTLGSAH